MKALKGFLLLLFIALFTQCDYLPFQKKKDLVPLDTIVDFTTVDAPPTFISCKDLIDKEKKANCFRNTLSKLVSEELNNKDYSKDLIVRSDVDEVVNLKIQFDREGVLQLKDVQLSKELVNEIPAIKSIFQKTIQKLPKVFPAIKRGIPVATEYVLPVRIKLEN